MRDVDVILGMDGLTANFATNCCDERRIFLHALNMEPIVYHRISMNRRTAIISALQATAMIKKGRPAYLVYLNGEEKEERRVEDVAAVRDFFSQLFPSKRYQDRRQIDNWNSRPISNQEPHLCP